MIRSFFLVMFTILVTKIVAIVQTDGIVSNDHKKTGGPIISPSLGEKVLQKGDNFTIKCKGKVPLFLKQQDIPEEVVGPFKMNLRREQSTEADYESLALDLINVDQFAVGYYACFDNTVDGNAVLNDLVEEPNNTEHVSYIYIYVNGSDNLFAPIRENVFLGNNKPKVVIGCKPTAPDIKISLTADLESEKFSPKIGYVFDSNVFEIGLIFNCNFIKPGHHTVTRTVIIEENIPTPDPEIRGEEKYILGETFSLNCSVHYFTSTVVQLQWEYPGENATGNVQFQSNEHISAIDSGELYNTIIITNATEENQGEYICIVKSVGDSKRKSFKKELVEPKLGIMVDDQSDIVETPQKIFSKLFILDAYPPVTIWSLYKDGKKLQIENSKTAKYSVHTNERNDTLYVLIKRLTVEDTGNYTLFVSNKERENTSKPIDLRVIEKPVIRLFPDETVKLVVNKPITIKAMVTGYRFPIIDWVYSNRHSIKIITEHVHQETIYNKTVTLEVSLSDSCNITCKAEINGNIVTKSLNLLAYEYENGFAIIDDNTWYPENQPFVKHCSASIYDFIDVFWSRRNGTQLVNFTKNTGKLSYDAELKIERISLDQAGEYICTGIRTDGTRQELSINITVEGTRLPVIENNTEETHEVLPFQPEHFSCYAEGVPRPKIEWRKDDIILTNTSNIIIDTINLTKTAVNSTVFIKQVQDNEKGKYVCKATNEGADDTKTFYLVIKDKTIYKTIIVVTVVVIVVLIVGVLYLLWKIRKEKQFKRELKAIGLYFFKNGVPKSINPDLFIDEQAELLPYDEKFEFPLDKLILGKQLGAGAFGVVYKAEARGIIDAEKTTTVAVKMVKKTADNMYIKALASELKIMVHLGKHVNIVNLLGACTKNIARRELIVIVEYCKFGNLHNYLQKHREVFIDQLSDSKENQFGKINRGYSCSSGNSGLQSDYFGSNQTQLTDHTFLNNTANTNRSSRKVSETGYVLNSEATYESDCSFLRALCTRDLLCWAFQIARGMEYLSSRKVLHGDLAARNILLAEDNIVKICDFGLSRSMYKNDEYLKKGDGLLPVKWLAIECMTDRIFSTQSDVWAFGIVMWELFSLAKTPYPNIRLENVMQFLMDGNRLEKPPHADDRLYEVMKSCWEQKPTLRPTFSQLQETLGSFLEDNVRNHYIDLNAMYIDMNKRAEGQEDYLAMVCAPDYNIMVAPSPHHYVNGDAAQMQMQHDSEGYLQMSPAAVQNIFSPRLPNTKFDFDVKKTNPKISGSNGHESELTPMLPINRLTPINGSESDIECNLSHSPHPCPRIDEESDEVFEIKQNNTKNNQSISQTNPIYITFDNNCLDKITQNNVNSYANLPNGFVS